MKKPKFPKTSLEDYFKYREAFVINLSSMMKRSEKPEEIKKVLDKVYTFYEKCFSPGDFYQFGKIDEVKDFLEVSSFFSKELIEEAIEHEKEHVEMAKELGYGVKGYSAILLLDYRNNKPSFALQVRINSGENISYEDFKKMCLAPKKPSLIDLVFR